MLAFSLKCVRLREISLVLLCSYFLYINDKSVTTWLRQKGWNILTFGFCLSSIAQPVTAVGALCVLSGKRTKLHNKYFCYCFIPYHISSAPQAFCFLKCSLLARNLCQMLVLSKINTMLACSQKTLYTPTLYTTIDPSGWKGSLLYGLRTDIFLPHCRATGIWNAQAPSPEVPHSISNVCFMGIFKWA